MCLFITETGAQNLPLLELVERIWNDLLWIRFQPSKSFRIRISVQKVKKRQNR